MGGGVRGTEEEPLSLKSLGSLEVVTSVKVPGLVGSRETVTV